MGSFNYFARAFISGLLNGLASPAKLYAVRAYKYPYSSPQEALEKDAAAIAGDFDAIVFGKHGADNER